MSTTSPNSRSRMPRRPAAHEAFLQLLPAIREQARFVFRYWPTQVREEALQEVIVRCFVAFVRLVERGEQDRAFASSLTAYAIKQFCGGRRTGTPSNRNDLHAAESRGEDGVVIQSLYFRDEQSREWTEIIIEDRRSGPAETAIFRLDFAAWLATLSRRQRRIAAQLAVGEKATRVARSFGVSDGRISQIRAELHRAWLCFHGEVPAAVPA